MLWETGGPLIQTVGDRDFRDDSEDNLVVAFSGYLQSKFYPKKVQTQNITICLLQIFSIVDLIHLMISTME